MFTIDHLNVKYEGITLKLLDRKRKTSLDSHVDGPRFNEIRSQKEFRDGVNY